jgi:hypothetical protein
MLKATLEFPGREAMDVFCRVRPHNPDEADLVFQEQLRAGEARSAAATVPAKESKAAGAEASATAKLAGEKPTTDETFYRRGKLRYLSDCSAIFFDDIPFNLQKRKKAQACLKVMTEKGAFSRETALHLTGEINPAVIKFCGFGTKHEIKIQGYFANAGDLTGAAKKFIASAGGGKYYLKTD